MLALKSMSKLDYASQTSSTSVAQFLLFWLPLGSTSYVRHQPLHRLFRRHVQRVHHSCLQLLYNILHLTRKPRKLSAHKNDVVLLSPHSIVLCVWSKKRKQKRRIREKRRSCCFMDHNDNAWNLVKPDKELVLMPLDVTRFHDR